jgi:ribonuclease HI
VEAHNPDIEEGPGWKEEPCEGADIEGFDEYLTDKVERAKNEDNKRDPEMQKEQVDPFEAPAKVARLADKEINEEINLCFWNRGIIPKHLATSALPSQATTYEAGNCGRVVDGCIREVYVDGSGTHADPRLRRCGWGIAWLNSNEGSRARRFGGSMCGGLGNVKHAVPKAELEAVIQAVERINWREGGLTIYSDCKYVCDGFENQRWKLKDPGAHKERWLEPGELVRDSSEVGVAWVEAHGAADYNKS